MNCINCGLTTKNKKFCSSSCAAKVNNKIPKRKHSRVCFCCNAPTSNQKFCSIACAAKQKHLDTISKYEKGELKTDSTVKACLIEATGYVCSLCSNTGTHNDMPLVLQLDHIDGNSDNNMPSNLRLLCPNCHSQTETFCFKGKTHKNSLREEKRRARYSRAKMPRSELESEITAP